MTEDVRRYRRYVLFVLLAVFTSSHVDRHILNILLESIRQEFTLTDTQLGLLSGVAFAIFYATLGVPLAMWADRGNRRNLVVLSLSIWSLMTALCGMAGNFVQLLLYRIGVGVGEAGANPPSHSMLADLFPPEERSTAMGIFGAGANFGVLIGFLLGGWLNQLYGWRIAFLAVGAPGLALAALVALTVREPQRGAADGMAGRVEDAPPLWVVVRRMASTPSLVVLILASSAGTFVAYSSVTWIPAYLLRTFDVQSGLVGTTLSFAMGAVGGAGTLFGGVIADRLARRDPRWRLWFGAGALIVAIPFFVAMLFVQSFWGAVALYLLPAFASIIYTGPTFALVQSLMPVPMRSVAASVNLLIINLVGLGLGPLTVGLLSDAYVPRFGDDSLRWALLTITLLWVLASVLFCLSARTLHRDQERVLARS